MSTYSIVGYDPNSEELGVAVQSRFLAVGALVPWVMANVGAVATQAKTNVHYGVKVLQKLQEGQDVNSVVAEVIQEDADYQRRQIGILNAQGQGALLPEKPVCPGPVIGWARIFAARATAYPGLPCSMQWLTLMPELKEIWRISSYRP